MAYASVTGTKSASAGHGSTAGGNGHKAGAGSATVAGDVYLAWDTTAVTNLSTLKGILRDMLSTVEQGFLR